MMLFARAYKNLEKGCLIRNKTWPQDYYIYKEESKLKDSHGNIFAHNSQEFYNENYHILDNSGPIWEIYEEVNDNNL